MNNFLGLLTIVALLAAMYIGIRIYHARSKMEQCASRFRRPHHYSISADDISAMDTLLDLEETTEEGFALTPSLQASSGSIATQKRPYTMDIQFEVAVTYIQHLMCSLEPWTEAQN